MPWALKGAAIVPQGFESEGLSHQGALCPGLGLEHHVIRQDFSQIILTLLVDATGIAGDGLPEVLAGLDEGLLLFEGSEARFKIHMWKLL